MRLESEFNMEIPDSAFYRFVTVGDVVQYIEVNKRQ